MDLLDLLRPLQVALGIGLVIFVHELGHFLAARWCGVRVEVFSLGFGPTIVALRRGDTTYQLAAIPFGGYVRMAGEGQLGGRPAPDELGAKSVGARFFVYSGGVLMNLLFALVAFPIAYRAGVPITPPRIGAPAPGGAAWVAGVPTGSLIKTLDGEPVRDFEQLIGAVALGEDRRLALTWEGPHGEPGSASLQAKQDPRVGFRRLGLRVGADTQAPLLLGEEAEELGFRPGDRLVAVQGLPAELPLEAQLSWGLDAGLPLRLTLASPDGAPRTLEVPTTTEALEDRLIFGLGPGGLAVEAVRDRAARLGLETGDLLQSLGGSPLHGPRDLRSAALAAPVRSELTVRRGSEILSFPFPDTALERIGLVDDLALGQEGVGSRVWIDPLGAAHQAGLPSGIEVLAIEGVSTPDWPAIQEACSRAVEATGTARIRYRMREDGSAQETLVQAQPARATRLPFEFASPSAVFRTTGLAQSVREGAKASWRFLVDTATTLKRMATRDVSPRNLGGIITISRVSYEVSSLGWAKLLFFLCILSVNLAFLNVLPIPVLDGGHLFFLLVEGIKGSPVSPRTLGYSQMVGMVLIVTLMVYVTYNDLMRLIVS